MSALLHATQTSVNRPLYQSGDRGAEVSVLQQYLAAAGYSPGKVDGVYGPSTVLAVQQFQQSQGLNPDGVVWLDTFNALANTVNDANPTTSEARLPPQQLDFNANLQPDPGADQAASGSGFPQWAIYLGVAAAGALALYFLSTRFVHRKPAMAGYADDEGCSCEPRHQTKRRMRR
jgi:peptidoglycan hydrolase-like protein with peptidoglycan-binding domain